VSANESATIGDIRTVISGQAAYQSANAGLYDGNMACLVAPSVGCIVNYAATAPTFVDSQIASLLPKSGYSRTFYAAAPPALPPNASPSSSSAFVYVTSPLNIGQSGVRGFGGDSSGVLCYSPNGNEPPQTANTALSVGNADCIVLQ
jgi:hypothetical protein